MPDHSNDDGDLDDITLVPPPHATYDISTILIAEITLEELREESLTSLQWQQIKKLLTILEFTIEETPNAD